MKVEIVNQQKLKRINLKQFRAAARKILKILACPQSVSIVICDNKLIKKLNKQYFKKTSATDVIAFPLADYCGDYLGEVVISLDEAIASCATYGNSWRQELLIYLIHGILHLLGYTDTTATDRARIEKKQAQILKKL